MQSVTSKYDPMREARVCFGQAETCVYARVNIENGQGTHDESKAEHVELMRAACYIGEEYTMS